jgi:hypothetical protein
MRYLFFIFIFFLVAHMFCDVCARERIDPTIIQQGRFDDVKCFVPHCTYIIRPGTILFIYI